MSLTILLVLVVVTSFAVGHLLAQHARRYVALSGAEYLLVGVLIGPQIAPRLLTLDSLMMLSPLVSLLLGLVGFILGLRAPRALAQIRYASTGLFAGAGVLVLVGAAVMLLTAGAFASSDAAPVFAREMLHRGDWALDLYITQEQLWLGVAVGAAACVASPFVVESTSRMLGAKGPVSNMLSVAATTTQVVAVVAAGVVQAAARATSAANQLGLGVGRWAAAAAGVGIACGLLFSLFIGRERDTPRIFLASLGAVIFASGIGAAIGISPLFVNLIAGATVALTSPLAGRLREEMDRLQHAAFVLVMIFAGAFWAPAGGRLWLLPVAYLLVRFAARRVLTRVATRLWTNTPAHASRLGNGLMSQGTMAVAIGLDFAQRFPELSAAVLTTVLVGTLASDLWSIRALRGVLLDAGEVAVLAVLKETGAKGRMADLVLGAAVLKDIVVVVMLALAVSVSRAVLAPDSDLDVSVIWLVLREIGSSIAAGALLGVLLILYLKYIRVEMLLFVAAMILVVSELGRALHLELLLVFITAGFVVRNFSRHEHDLFEPLTLVSLPVFVVFFTNAGAGVDLRNTWKILPVALAVCGVRALAYYLSARIGGSLGREPEVVRKTAWLGYLPQAGVTLSLVGIAAQQLPELQSPILTMGVAIVAINLFVGPLAVRHVLRLPVPAAADRLVAPPRATPDSSAGPGSRVQLPEPRPVLDVADALKSISDTDMRNVLADLERSLRTTCSGFVGGVFGRWVQAFGADAAGCVADPRPIESNAAFLSWIKKPHHNEAATWGAACLGWLADLRRLVGATPDVMLSEIERKHREPQPDDPARVRLLKQLVSAFRFMTFQDKRPMRRVYVRHICRVVLEPHLSELASRTYAAWCRAAAAVFEAQRTYAAGLRPSQDVAAALQQDLAAASEAIQHDIEATLGQAFDELCDALSRVGTPLLSARDLRYSKIEPKVHQALRQLEEDPSVWAAKLDAARSACRVAAELARIQAALQEAFEAHLLSSADHASQGVCPVIQAVRERIEAVRDSVAADPFPDGEGLRKLEACCHSAFADDAEHKLDRAASQFRPAVTIHNVAVALRDLVPALPEKVPVNRPELLLHLARSPRDVTTRTVNLRDLASQKLLRDLLPFIDERADESSARLAGAASRIREAVDMVHEAVSSRRELVDADGDDDELIRQTVERSIARLDELRAQLVAGVIHLRGDLEAATSRTFAELRQIATGEADATARAEPEAAGARAWRAFVALTTPVRRRWEDSVRRTSETWTRLQGSRVSRELVVRYRGAAMTAAELGDMTRTWQRTVGVPDAYARLFSSDPVREPRRFTANRPQQASLLAAERAWLEDGPSGALIVGDHGSGKTSLMNVCELDVRAPRVIRPQRWRVQRDGGFVAALGFELGCRPRDRDIVAKLRETRTTVLLDDLEHWFTPDAEGVSQLEHMLGLIVRTRHHAFWAATVSTHGLRLLEELAAIRPVFGHVFDLEPLDAGALAQAVEARHALSGLRIQYPTSVASKVLNRFRATSDRMMFFRMLRRVSDGNLSRALASWVRCVAVEEEGAVCPRLHRVVSLGFLSLGKLGPHETAVLVQVLRFGPMQAVELARSLHVTRSEVDRNLAFLEAAGLLERGEGTHGELRIPPAITVPVQQALRTSGVPS